MSKVSNYIKAILVIPLAIAIASYASVISQELKDDYYYTTDPHVLVDASRDGGAWWYPQHGVFNPELYHQGKYLADYLESQGMLVTELPRPFTITADLLSGYHLVIRANHFSAEGYAPDEIDAYQEYVANGGILVLLADATEKYDPDPLAIHFGLNLQGTYFGEVNSFIEHPITLGLEFIPYQAGSVLAEDPPTHTTELGFIDDRTAMGILPYGFGQVFFIGDFYEIIFAQQPLTENLFNYFLTFEGLASQVLAAALDAEADSGLMVKLEAALNSSDAGKPKTMQNQLQAFINQVEALRNSGRLDNVTADQLIGAAMTLMTINQNVSMPACPCWTPEDIAALPIKKTTANCATDGSRLDIFQQELCEHAFGVAIDPDGNMSCVTNRYSCPGLPDLGGGFIETNEDEFMICLDQVVSRCEDLGIDPPDFP